MLSDPKRLRTRSGHGYLVSWKHRLRTQSEPAAAAIVERLLEDPQNIEALRNAIGRPEATMDELAQWLVTGLASGALNLLKTRLEPPLLDSPPETDLFDLLPPEQPKAELESLTFELVDQEGESVEAQYQLQAPGGDTSGSMPANERKFVGELQPNADVEVEFLAVVLPLRPTSAADDAPQDDEASAPTPAPLGPGGVEPELPRPPAPLGPDTHAPTAVSLSCEEGSVVSVESSVSLSSEPTTIEGDRVVFSELQLSDR